MTLTAHSFCITGLKGQLNPRDPNLFVSFKRVLQINFFSQSINKSECIKVTEQTLHSEILDGKIETVSVDYLFGHHNITLVAYDFSYSVYCKALKIKKLIFFIASFTVFSFFFHQEYDSILLLLYY